MLGTNRGVEIAMSALENAQMRLAYRGGIAEDRMIQDKLKSLKKALLYSYQSQTVQLLDGREFKCLINPNKLKEIEDDKILSIPFKDICLNKDKIGKTSEGIEEIGLQGGDTFLWKDTNTHWIVYLQHLEEKAYFRAEIKKCRAEVTIGENSYWVALEGPTETSIQWNSKHNTTWNDINYSMILTVTKNEETLDYFHRFTNIEIDGKNWVVEVVNSVNGDGIIEVCLGEDYNNTIQKEADAEKAETIIEENLYIKGPTTVKPYDEITYTIENKSGGTWILDSAKATISAQTETSVDVEIISGKSGTFNLIYRIDGEDDIVLNVTIESL